MSSVLAPAGRPISGEHGGVELVVQFAQHADQALGVDELLFGGQRPAVSQRGEHVVEAGEREDRAARRAGVGRQHALAVRVDLLGKLGDALAQLAGSGRCLRLGRGRFRSSGICCSAGRCLRPAASR
ncbi:MAG: hypothetical protein V9G23_16815 [Giesbergeria sp.]